MSEHLGKMEHKLLHRYSLHVTKDRSATNANADRKMEVLASFYRRSLDPAYQLMVADLIEAGCFDPFIAAVLQGLVHQGECFTFSICRFLFEYFCLISV